MLAAGSRLLGKIFWKVRRPGASSTRSSVDGSANSIGFIAGVVRRVQSGFLYSYAFWMVIGLAVDARLVPDARLSQLNNENTCRGFRFFRS